LISSLVLGFDNRHAKWSVDFPREGSPRQFSDEAISPWSTWCLLSSIDLGKPAARCPCWWT